LLRRPINSCKTCSEPLPIEGSPEEICIHCRLFPLGASNFDSLFLYKAPIETLIKSWKYGNQEHIGNFFAEKLRDQLDTGIHTGKEIILSIPSSPSNTRIRGFFPLGEMCRKLSKSLSIPYYPLALRLSNNHQAQSKVKIASRVQNIANKIKLDDTDITGKDVILIDDVATTGSSIKAASHLLNSAGVNSIKAVTIARSPRFQANRLNANISYDTVNKHTPRRAFA
jgi:ComF family protein